MIQFHFSHYFLHSSSYFNLTYNTYMKWTNYENLGTFAI